MRTAEIASLLKNAALTYGNKTALTLSSGGAYTFTELDDLAGRFAGGLAQLGIRRGDRVTLYVPNGWEWIVAYHGIARLGAVVVPANILLSMEEVAFMAANSGSTALIMPANREMALAQSESPLVVKRDWDGAPVAFFALLQDLYLDPVEVTSNDLVTIGYTSGTTGRPKGAMLTHGCVHASLVATTTQHVRHSGDTLLTALPFPHVYGNIVMNSALVCGARLVAMPRFDAGEALGLISREQVTLFEGVPTMYYQMLAQPGIASANLSTLTRCTVGGQTMPLAKIEAVVQRFGCPLLELWGMTELAGPAVTHSPYWVPRHGSIGLPVPGLEARICDLEDRTREAASGSAGELMVRGPLVMAGYWQNDSATADAIDRDGWLATGDVAQIDDEGFVTIVDRKKDLIITAGYNIYPAELEQVIAMHPAVAMVAVAGVADDEKGEIARAVVVRHANAELGEAELLEHCSKHLARYKIPKLITFADDLPRTSTGKILRRALR